MSLVQCKPMGHKDIPLGLGGRASLIGSGPSSVCPSVGGGSAVPDFWQGAVRFLPQVVGQGSHLEHFETPRWKGSGNAKDS